MRANRMIQGLAIGAAAAALTVAGCSRDKQDDADEAVSDNGNGNGNGDTADTADTAGAVPVASGDLPAGVSYANFPADSEVIFGVAFAPVRDSALWQNYRDMVLSVVDGDGELAEFEQACGFEPFAKLDSVVFGGPTADDDRMVVVVSGFSRDEVEACAKGVAEAEGEEFSITADGDLAQYSMGGDEVWVAWLDDSTLMTGGRADSDKEWLEARASGADGLAEDSPLAQLIEAHVDRTSGVWFGMIPADDSPIGGGMAAAGGSPPEAVYGAVAPGEGLAISAGVRFGSADEAQELLTQSQMMMQGMKMQMGDLGKFVDKLEMSTDDADVLVNISLTEAELTELVEGVGAMFGGMMGGMPH